MNFSAMCMDTVSSALTVGAASIHANTKYTAMEKSPTFTQFWPAQVQINNAKLLHGLRDFLSCWSLTTMKLFW